MMSKGLHWTLLVITLLVVCDYLIISYWRDSININISASTLITMLIGLPLSIVFGLYVITQLFKFSKNKLTHRNQTKPSSIEDDNITNDQGDQKSTDLDKNILLPAQYLFILETALVTPFGNDITQIMAKLQKKKTAEPDPLLKYENTYPYLSQRVQSMPAFNDDEKMLFKQKTSNFSLASRPLFTDRAKRVEQITIQLFEKLSLVLRSIDIKQLYPQQEEIAKSKNQARLHPEWVSQVGKQISQDLPVVYRPQPNLKVLYILPNHLSDVEKEILSGIPEQYLKLLDINEQHDVSYHVDYVESSDETQELVHKMLVAHSNLDHEKDPQLLLIMGVDSWIDQAYLDIKFDKEKESVQPSEGGFAILFSEQKLATDIDPLAKLTKPLIYKCHQSIRALNQEMAENIIRSVEQIQQAYEVDKSDKALENNEVVIVDNKPIQAHALVDLNSLSNSFQIDSKQIISASHILNDTNTMISGLSLTLAIGNTIETNENTMLINNAGTQVGTSWVVMPHTNSSNEIETTLGNSV